MPGIQNDRGRPERIGTASVAIMEWGFSFVILNGVRISKTQTNMREILRFAQDDIAF